SIRRMRVPSVFRFERPREAYATLVADEREAFDGPRGVDGAPLFTVRRRRRRRSRLRPFRLHLELGDLLPRAAHLVGEDEDQVAAPRDAEGVVDRLLL